MKRNYNYQAFTPEEVEAGLLDDLLKYIVDYNKKCESGYYDTHITSDGYCTIVEWTDVNFKFKGEEGSFRFVDSDEVVMKEVHFPDDHYEMVYPEEAEEVLNNWLKENPEWVKNQWGTWTNTKEENEAFAKLVQKNIDEWAKEGSEDD